MLTKAYDALPALVDLAPRLSRDAVVVLLPNGMGHYEEIRVRLLFGCLLLFLFFSWGLWALARGHAGGDLHKIGSPFMPTNTNTNQL